jgi:phospholipase C
LDLSKIKHLFVLMLENRSFDHMLGYSNIPDIDGLSGQAFTNRDAVEEPVHTTPDAGYAGSYDVDPGHDFVDVQMQLYGTARPAAGQQPNMSGFVKSYGAKCGGDVAKSHRVMKCFSPEKLPVLVTLAKHFAVCDRWFSSLPGPTLPNRLFVHCGTSDGRLDMSPEYFAGFRSVYEVLDKASPNGVSAAIYCDGWTSAATFNYLLRHQKQFFGTLEDFYSACDGSEADVPAYCFIEPRYSSGLVGPTFYPQSDQHPDSDVRQGEKLIYKVYKAIRKNRKLWESSILVITYDEHGGLSDHALPPPCPAPDNKPGDLGFDFKRLGVRVPAVIVSPYIDATVSHTQFDHTSLIATARKLFTGAWQDDTLGSRAGKANTLDGPDILNRDEPRNDDVAIPVATPPPPSQEPARIGTLQRAHVEQAAYLNQTLPPDKRVATDLNTITTDQQADEYVRQVFAAATGVRL